MLWRRLQAWCQIWSRSVGSVAGDRGRLGEDTAARFLAQQRGWTVVTRNWRNPRDQREEIDIVARDGDVLVFVEVKARQTKALVRGIDAVDFKKKKILRRATRAYCKRLLMRPRTVRFDVVEVELVGGEVKEVHHYVNVPLFPKGFRA